MKKSLLFIFVLLFGSNLFSQVLIDQTKTPSQITIQDLIGVGVSVSNITFNGTAANANLLRDQIGLFSNGLTSPVNIDSGVILSTGNSLVAQIGTGTTNPPFPQRTNASNASATPIVGDSDLAALVTGTIRNVAVLEFDFVPTSSFVEFNYVFASEEYPEFTPCSSGSSINDVFGFFISGPGITGPYSNSSANIALIPGTTLPISINNINHCSPYNAYYVDNSTFVDPSTGLVNPNTVQYDGMTTVLTARANVQCGQTYHIKLAIGNVSDNGWDSAVFIKANSFSVPTVDLGPDRILCGAATCVTLNANFALPLPAGFNPTYNWYLDGVFQTSTTVPTLTVCQSGVWRVDVLTPGCGNVVTSDEIIVSIIGIVPFNPIGPFTGPAGDCNPSFNLLSYQAALVAPQDPANFTFVYYDENFDIITDPANFSTTTNTFVGVEISLGPCSNFDIIEFNVDCNCELELTSATETTDQTICIGESIVDITYTFGGNATDVTVVDLPAGVTATVASEILTISGTPTTTGSFTYTVSTVDCSPELTLQGTITIADAPTFTNLSAVSPICEGEDAVFTLEGSAGATITYTINGGAIQTETLNASGEATITIPTTASGTIVVELSEIAIGGCIDALNETATVVVNPIPDVPTIDVTAPTCVLAGFATITNYDATLTYTFTPAGPTITAAGLIENVVFGTSYVVNADNGDCTSADSTPFTVEDILAVPDVPTIAITAPTCLAAGFATVANYVAGMTYDFTPAGPIVDGTGLISGMIFGTSYEVAANNGSCTSADSTPFTVEDILVTPAVPTIDVTAPTCVLAGFATITNYDATLTYTFTPAGPTITATGLIENVVFGTSYVVNADNADCTSADSTPFTVQDILAVPDVPTIVITAPTCLAAGFATVANYVAGMTYDFTPAGPIVDGTGLISGMIFGTSYEVAANNGSCSSVNTVPFSIEDILVTPAVPTIDVTAPTCVLAGFATITNYDATLTYTFTPAGPTITATGLIENVVFGTSYVVNADNGDCTSADSTPFTVEDILAIPDVPTVIITAPTCLAAGFATITNYVAGMTYDFTPAGPTVDGTGLISGMTFGTSYEVAANNGSCSSVNTAPFSIEDILVTPAVPTVATTAPTCTADGFTEITNYDATLTYTFTPAGPTITAAGLIENVIFGTSYVVNADNGDCTSADSTPFTVEDILAVPDVPTIAITAPTCLAAGFATITNYVAGMTYDFTPTGPTVDGTGLISGMTFGTSYEVAANNGSCSSVNAAPFSIEDILVTPAVPTVATTAPTCTADGFTEITNYDAALTYTFTPAGPTITAAGLIENMVVGTSYTVTAGNTTCTSSASASFSNAAQLITPAVPTISTTAPTCSSNGASTITNYNGTLTYIFTPTGPTVGAGGLISGMTVGTSYTVTAGNGTCTSSASTSFSNAAQLPAPVVTSLTNNGPICEAGNIVFTIIGTPNSVVSYSGVVGVPASTVTLNASGQATVTVAGATSNQTITLNTVTNSITGCSATISNTSTATVLPLPTANLSSANPATCSGGSVVLNFTGTPNAIVSFTDGTNNYNVTLDGAGVNNYTTPPISSTTTFTLTSVATTGTPSCSQIVGDSVTVVITPRPIMTASPNPLILCNGAMMNLVLNSSLPGTTYTWSASTTNIQGSFVLDGTGTDINQVVQLQDPMTIGYVTIVVIPRANNCDGDPLTIQVVVNPIPEIREPVGVSSETICSNNEVTVSFVGVPSGLSYTWQAVNVNGVTIVGGLTSGTSTTGDINVTLVTTDPLVAGTIQFEITPIRNGCTGVSVLSPVITVNPIPGTPISQPISEICSGNGANLNISATLPTIAGTELDWEIVENVNVTGGFATQGSGVAPIYINDLLFNVTNQQGFVRYRVTSRLNGCIGNTTDFIVYVNPEPRPTLQDGAICVDGSGVTFQTYVLQSGLSGTMYDFDWYYNGALIAGATGNTYTATQPGTYSLIVTNTLTGCFSEEVFANVIEVQPATAITYTVTDAFSNNATITVNVTGGSGTLLYQLDDEGFQESNIFTGVSAGPHTVTAIDTQGCTYLTADVFVIDYPPFFTPNGDGFNDTWNIFSLNSQTNAKIYIFDRYGKLLKQISPAGAGWDGTFNGIELPSTDYWFTVDYQENEQQKTFKAHFSLIR